ncbi:MAG: RNA pyrophosphohydrolase [Paracoccus sp. (in: a-proteobacteria)]|uniref:RNA pyrophosphohydrolase n=1 Tax=Paracoccus sp. TaxID=267 RepID=UPI0026DEE653|nr:RNA pyrophosphohydrolase [Paracoccus sp. (in: a-proteobacteria)]MDO5622843.1 RNA pyrophosphohydrolase [Paracoccus sp. (in: a-proteobacteria)]
MADDKRKGPGGLPYRPCAGVVLIDRGGMVFAGQRLDNAADAWQMPQGGIDKGEAPREAAVRELGEETGVTPDLVEIIAKTEGWIYYDLPEDLAGKMWKGKYGGQRQRWFLMRYHGTDAQINIQTEHPEFRHWQWMRADELVEKIVPFKRAVYEQVFAEFREYLA